MAHFQHAVVDKPNSSFDEHDIEDVDDVTNVVHYPPIEAILWRLITTKIRHDTVTRLSPVGRHCCTAVVVCNDQVTTMTLSLSSPDDRSCA